MIPKQNFLLSTQEEFTVKKESFPHAPFIILAKFARIQTESVIIIVLDMQ